MYFTLFKFDLTDWDGNFKIQINPRTEPAVKQGEKRLMVKVIKAIGLGLKQGKVVLCTIVYLLIFDGKNCFSDCLRHTGCSEPYCVIEVDDPFQKKQTSTKKNTSSPQWNENFIL
jgi:Ca2+-dependent lipid-binding protein